MIKYDFFHYYKHVTLGDIVKVLKYVLILSGNDVYIIIKYY